MSVKHNIIKCLFYPGYSTYSNKYNQTAAACNTVMLGFSSPQHTMTVVTLHLSHQFCILKVHSNNITEALQLQHNC
jgi:hypothetical protein